MQCVRTEIEQQHVNVSQNTLEILMLLAVLNVWYILTAHLTKHARETNALTRVLAHAELMRYVE
jgi:hypothetical protein